jgi:hypothetical protein
MLVTWEQLQRKVRRSKMLRSAMQIRNAQVCPTCQECYEPCVEVAIIGHNAWHLVPVSVHRRFARGCSYEFVDYVFPSYEFVDYVFPFCASRGRVRIQGEPLWCIVRSKCAERRFLWMLARRYPQLLDSPLTESVLREAGCDIEAEWALWQLGGG